MEVEGEIVSCIGAGIVVLAGLCAEDTADDAEYCARKCMRMRLWERTSDGSAWRESVLDRKYETLLVSQFTLYADTTSNKPDYRKAMKADDARKLFDSFVGLCRKEESLAQPTNDSKGQQKPTTSEIRVKTGVFQAMMKVRLCNDGPITILVDSKNRTAE